MTRERFEELAEAYGGDVARWPRVAREAAAVLMATDAAFTAGVLQRAQSLDAALNEFALKPASRSLQDHIVASAPTTKPARGWRTWLLPAGLSASLAAACAAGVIAGVQFSQEYDNGDVSAATAVADLDVSGLAEEV